MYEKAGINTSVVYGVLPPEAVKQMKSRGKDLSDENVKFFATGNETSAIVHLCFSPLWHFCFDHPEHREF